MQPAPGNNYIISTPHACVKIWNFDDRITNGTPNQNYSGSIKEISNVNETILTTVSCVSIHTNKSKGSPVGSFEVVLAPTYDWLSRITAGSWCVIMMSNGPIGPNQLTNADAAYVKMIGKIESVRAEVNVDEMGTRHTRYIMSGVDWGHVLNNVIYIDNLIAGPNDPTSQGNVAAINLQKQMFGDGNSPQSFKVVDNLTSLLNLFGTSSPLYATGKEVDRLAASIYDFVIPTEMAKFCRFIDADDNVNLSTKLSDVLGIQSGKLVGYNAYQDSNDAYGFIDPFSVQGTNTFWQLLQDNNNPALNELYNEVEWQYDNTGQVLGPSLTIYSRIKPFSYKPNPPPLDLRSPFTNLRLHRIDNLAVTSVTVSTNWRDKYNFVEVRPQFSDFAILGAWVAQKAQGFDNIAFNREGFRPMIVGTKQFPVNPSTIQPTGGTFNADVLKDWVALLKEWYFDTHRLLNGQIMLKNQREYIGVGNNIMFDANLINPTNNLSSSANTGAANGINNYILAHVESVDNNFTVDEFGTRSYTTTIQFVRGIIVTDNGAGKAPNVVGDGSLDQFAHSQSTYKNTTNTIGYSDPDDPDPLHLKGY
jgi:hypothetical protein